MIPELTMQERTLMAAKEFRDAASLIANMPPPVGIHPLLWKAQYESVLSMAESLEAEARGEDGA